jgi:hypothetical protein
MTERYRVHLDSVLECQMDDYNYDVKCKDFAEAKEYVLDAFETVINCLTYLCEQIRAAEEFDDLALGWWEPLFEEIESDSRPAEDSQESVDTPSERQDKEVSNDQ